MNEMKIWLWASGSPRLTSHKPVGTQYPAVNRRVQAQNFICGYGRGQG
jgi:hypothetical protein